MAKSTIPLDSRGQIDFCRESTPAPTVRAKLLVQQIKLTTNDLMNGLLKVSQQSNNGEISRLVHNAMTAYEDAAMWAVKALTSPECNLKEEDAKR